MDEQLTSPPPPGPPGAPGPPWRAAEAVPVALLALVATFVAGAPIGALTSEGTSLVLIGLTFEVALAGATLLWVGLRHRAVPALRLGSPRPLREAVRGALAGVGIFGFTVLVVAPLLYGLLGIVTGEPVTAPQQEVLPANPSAWHVAVGGVVVVLLAPVGEELFFRGLLFGALRGRWRFASSAALSAAVFAVFHVLPLLMPLMFVVGYALAWLYERRGSLVVPMAAHAAFNVVGYTLIVFAL